MTAVPTVTGSVDSSELGRVLVHEHVFVLGEEYRLNYGEWDEQARVDDAVKQLDELKALGIDTILDPTVLGLGRYIPRIQQIAARTELNIVVATGVYTYNDVPFQFHHTGPGLIFDVPDPMVDLFVGDLTEGIAGTGVRAGFLKCAIEEPGLTPGVERVMRAVGQASVRTGAPITVHTNPHTRSGLVAQRVLREEGVDLTRVVIGHSGDSTDLDYLAELAEAGSLLGMDRFGIDVLLPFEDRVNTIVELVRRGYRDQVTIAHDAACFIDWFTPEAKQQMAPKWNYRHISEDVIPALLDRGLTDDDIDAILVRNPRRYFEGQQGRSVMSQPTTSHDPTAGTCDERFAEVQRLLAENIDSGAELGAAIAITVDGVPVVDIWGGWADAEKTRPWERDTITNVWSCTKTVTALAGLMLVERGLLDVEAPVAKYWPEFAAAGKETVLVRHLLSHTSGVSAWEQPMTVPDLYDLPTATARLAAQAPWWEPGTASGYHLINYGHLIGELIRRIDGRSLGRFVAEEIAGPLHADFHIGLPESEYDRIANVVPPPGPPIDPATLDPEGIMMRSFLGPIGSAEAAWTPEWRSAEIGGANGHGNARALARIQSVIACGGAVDGVRLLSPETIDLIFQTQSDGVDLVLGVPLRFGIGFGLPSASAPHVPDRRVCFWGGWGGSIIAIDTDRRATIAYVMNKMGSGVLGNERTHAYTKAAFAALG